MPCGDGGDVGGLGGGDSGDDVGSVRPRAQAEGRIGGGGRRQKLRALRRGLSVLEKAIARGRVLVYAGHYSIPSICPASAGHFFVVANCCYRASCPRCCVALGKNALEALTRNPRGGRAQPIAPAARAAPQHHHLARDAEHLGHLPDSEVVELVLFHSARSRLWRTRRESACRLRPKMMGLGAASGGHQFSEAQERLPGANRRPLAFPSCDSRARSPSFVPLRLCQAAATA